MQPSAKQWTLYGTSVAKNTAENLLTAIWLIFITSTTVGYGDVTPVTHAGRFVCVLAALGGVLLASFTTAACTNAITWSCAEARALQMLRRRHAQLQMHEKAASYISLWWRRKLIRPDRLPRHRARLRRVRAEFLELKQGSTGGIRHWRTQCHVHARVSTSPPIPPPGLVVQLIRIRLPCRTSHRSPDGVVVSERSRRSWRTLETSSTLKRCATRAACACSTRQPRTTMLHFSNLHSHSVPVVRGHVDSTIEITNRGEGSG